MPREKILPSPIEDLENRLNIAGRRATPASGEGVLPVIELQQDANRKCSPLTETLSAVVKKEMPKNTYQQAMNVSSPSPGVLVIPNLQGVLNRDGTLTLSLSSNCNLIHSRPSFLDSNQNLMNVPVTRPPFSCNCQLVPCICNSLSPIQGSNVNLNSCAITPASETRRKHEGKVEIIEIDSDSISEGNDCDAKNKLNEEVVVKTEPESSHMAMSACANDSRDSEINASQVVEAKAKDIDTTDAGSLPYSPGQDVLNTQLDFGDLTLDADLSLSSPLSGLFDEFTFQDLQEVDKIVSSIEKETAVFTKHSNNSVDAAPRADKQASGGQSAAVSQVASTATLQPTTPSPSQGPATQTSRCASATISETPSTRSDDSELDKALIRCTATLLESSPEPDLRSNATLPITPDFMDALNRLYEEKMDAFNSVANVYMLDSTGQRMTTEDILKTKDHVDMSVTERIAETNPVKVNAQQLLQQGASFFRKESNPASEVAYPPKIYSTMKMCTLPTVAEETKEENRPVCFQSGGIAAASQKPPVQIKVEAEVHSQPSSNSSSNQLSAASSSNDAASSTDNGSDVKSLQSSASSKDSIIRRLLSETSTQPRNTGELHGEVITGLSGFSIVSKNIMLMPNRTLPLLIPADQRINAEVIAKPRNLFAATANKPDDLAEYRNIAQAKWASSKQGIQTTHQPGMTAAVLTSGQGARPKTMPKITLKDITGQTTNCTIPQNKALDMSTASYIVPAYKYNQEPIPTETMGMNSMNR